MRTGAARVPPAALCAAGRPDAVEGVGVQWSSARCVATGPGVPVIVYGGRGLERSARRRTRGPSGWSNSTRNGDAGSCAVRTGSNSRPITGAGCETGTATPDAGGRRDRDEDGRGCRDAEGARRADDGTATRAATRRDHRGPRARRAARHRASAIRRPPACRRRVPGASSGSRGASIGALEPGCRNDRKDTTVPGSRPVAGSAGGDARCAHAARSGSRADARSRRPTRGTRAVGARQRPRARRPRDTARTSRPARPRTSSAVRAPSTVAPPRPVAATSSSTLVRPATTARAITRATGGSDDQHGRRRDGSLAPAVIPARRDASRRPTSPRSSMQLRDARDDPAPRGRPRAGTRGSPRPTGRRAGPGR